MGHCVENDDDFGHHYSFCGRCFLHDKCFYPFIASRIDGNNLLAAFHVVDYLSCDLLHWRDKPQGMARARQVGSIKVANTHHIVVYGI